MIRILQQDSRLIKIIFAVIISLAVITMVITLVPGIFDNSGSTGDATVFATVHSPGILGRLSGDSSQIKTAEVDQLAQRQLQQQKLPDFLLPYMANRAGQILVQRAILKHEADRLHLQVSDEDLRRELKTGPFAQYLFPNGTYIGDDAYMNFVQAAFQTSRSDFESQVKQDMELNRLQALITGGVTVSDAAVRDAYLVQGTKVKFDYAVISADDVQKTINPSDAELQAFFKQNQSRYATAVPESRKIQYVSFDASNLPGGKPQVTDADIQAYYNQHQAQYQLKDQVKVRHILISVPQGADSKTDAAAKAKAEDILKQIKSGGNFADLASKNSDDPGSKTAGGELGWLDRGKTVPEFDKAAFSLPVGQTSDLIKTQFGYHILQVEDKKTAHLQPLAEVKPQIVPVLEQQKSGAAEQSFAQQLAAQAQKDGIEKTAAAHGLKAETTDYLGKDGTVAGLADGSALLTQAFGVAKGAAPATVSTGDGYAVFQVLDVKAAHAPDFADYKTHILTDYREQQVPQLLNAQLIKLDDRAKVLNDLKKAAAEMNITVKTSDLVGKDGQVPDLGAMTGPSSVAFTLAKGAISGPINTGRSGVVLSILDKQQPTADDIAKNFAQTREQLLNDQHEEIFRVYVADLTQKYEKSGAIRYSKKQPAPGSSPFGS
ncbi:peptidylprolyl isomerase [Granulicella arctica]|uniref:Periplasmic chaperone PpiD n=1 Tax=Granulicella arctica TaxID=940613 RepID=A0A7Y9PID2_9BACT|nr:peptidyl-prolyl cis-trans isomerase [Granulicella arctica]NYF80464.1 peptidyl-prolyl cis-trans isomerase D [Granulicella arctica]